MGNYKYLAKNIGVLALSNFATKLLSFFLVPLYTSILTTEEYGTYDLFATTVYLLVPILTLNIQDATIRFSLDKNYEKKDIISISLDIFGKGLVILLVFSAVNHVANLFPIFNDYLLVFVLMYIFQALVGIMTAFARGCEKITEISIASVLGSVVFIGLNILFLVIFKLGLMGYFLSSILGNLSQVLYLTRVTQTWRYLRFRGINKDTEGSMLKYSCPLIANTVAWWITNASDRYVVMWLCGTAANGIYSVAYKIPSILNILQSIFTQAWTLSAVKEFDPEDKDGFFSNMYNGFNCLMVLACSFLILSAKFFARILYAKDFYKAWEYVPFLLISIVFGATAGYIGGIFSALKEAKMLAQSTTIGAVVNIILNIVLVSMVGAIGAAVSTAISYIVVWGIRLCYMRRYLQAKLYLKRDIASYILLVIQAVLLLLIPSGCIMYMIQIVLFIMLIGFYRKEVLMPLKVLKSKVKSCR